MVRVALLFIILVITDPYVGIDYEEINVYIIEEECEENCIEIHYPEETEWPEYDE